MAERRLADLGIPLGRRTGQLSGGQQAQVPLALALAKRPRLLMLDEPVASLDPLARREFMETLMALVADDDLTVLLSSHNVAELERVCDHLVVITGGRVQLAGDIDDLLGDHQVLTGRNGHVPQGPDVIHVDQADRHAHVVTRTRGAEPMPGGVERMVWMTWRQHRGELLGAAPGRGRRTADPRRRGDHDPGLPRSPDPGGVRASPPLPGPGLE